jgi:hypothetical protein
LGFDLPELVRQAEDRRPVFSGQRIVRLELPQQKLERMLLWGGQLMSPASGGSTDYLSVANTPDGKVMTILPA